MFITELEALENAFLLKVTYGLQYKKWSYQHLTDAIIHRSRLEHCYVEGDREGLKEEMS